MPQGSSRLGFWFVNQSPPLPDPETPVEQFPNLGFEQGISGWTIAATRIRFGGLSNLAGFPTPPDPLPNPFGSPGDAVTVIQQPTFRYLLNTSDKPPLGQVQSMNLIMGNPTIGVVSPNGSTIFGPACYSNFFINFNSGDTVTFDWKALPGADAYTLYAYMVEKDTGAYLTLLRQAGSSDTSGTTWSSVVNTVPVSGAYKFVFVAGSWDYTYGSVVGGQMLIDNIRRN